jgi:hypothetical protein
MRQVIGKSLFLCVLGFAGAAAVSAGAQGYQDWVALAADGAGHWGWQFNPDPDVARQKAMAFCGHDGCEVQFTERDRCVAYAESRANGYVYGYGHARSHGEASQAAMDGCAQNAPQGTCTLVRSHCQGEND